MGHRQSSHKLISFWYKLWYKKSFLIKLLKLINQFESCEGKLYYNLSVLGSPFSIFSCLFFLVCQRHINWQMFAEKYKLHTSTELTNYLVPSCYLCYSLLYLFIWVFFSLWLTLWPCLCCCCFLSIFLFSSLMCLFYYYFS